MAPTRQEITRDADRTQQVDQRRIDEILERGRGAIELRDSPSGELVVPGTIEDHMSLAREVSYLRSVVGDMQRSSSIHSFAMSTPARAVAPSSESTLAHRPQLASLRPIRLFIDPRVAASFEIVDIRVGSVSKLDRGGPPPATLFSHGIGHALDVGVVNTAQDLVMVVRNTGPEPMAFSATWSAIQQGSGMSATPRPMATRQAASAAPLIGAAHAQSLLGAWYEIAGIDRRRAIDAQVSARVGAELALCNFTSSKGYHDVDRPMWRVTCDEFPQYWRDAATEDAARALVVEHVRGRIRYLIVSNQTHLLPSSIRETKDAARAAQAAAAPSPAPSPDVAVGQAPMTGSRQVTESRLIGWDPYGDD